LKLKAVPAVAVIGAVTVNLAAISETLIAFVTPVTVGLAISVAVMVWTPAESSVAVNVPMLPANFESAGKSPRTELVVKCTVPE
jgi:acyl-CoA hydrolase